MLSVTQLKGLVAGQTFAMVTLLPKVTKEQMQLTVIDRVDKRGGGFRVNFEKRYFGVNAGKASADVTRDGVIKWVLK